MSKKVSFAPKPTATTKTPDQWVQGVDQPTKGQGASDTPAEKMKRFTIDVSISLHARIKIACAKRGTKMADEIRLLLDNHFPDTLEGGKGQ